MAKRSHFSFNKRQKELRQKEKAEKKLQRRLLKRQRAAGDAVAQTAGDETPIIDPAEVDDSGADNGEDPPIAEES